MLSYQQAGIMSSAERDTVYDLAKFQTELAVYESTIASPFKKQDSFSAIPVSIQLCRSAFH